MKYKGRAAQGASQRSMGTGTKTDRQTQRVQNRRSATWNSARHCSWGCLPVSMALFHDIKMRLLPVFLDHEARLQPREATLQIPYLVLVAAAVILCRVHFRFMQEKSSLSERKSGHVSSSSLLTSKRYFPRLFPYEAAHTTMTENPRPLLTSSSSSKRQLKAQASLAAVVSQHGQLGVGGSRCGL